MLVHPSTRGAKPAATLATATTRRRFMVYLTTFLFWPCQALAEKTRPHTPRPSPRHPSKPSRWPDESPPETTPRRRLPARRLRLTWPVGSPSTQERPTRKPVPAPAPSACSRAPAPAGLERLHRLGRLVFEQTQAVPAHVSTPARRFGRDLRDCIEASRLAEGWHRVIGAAGENSANARKRLIPV